MNHTGVNTHRLSQVVKDEANRFLDAVEIGTDEEFVVCATEILVQIYLNIKFMYLNLCT